MAKINIDVGNEDGSYCGEAEIIIDKVFEGYDEAERYANNLKVVIEKHLRYLGD